MCDGQRLFRITVDYLLLRLRSPPNFKRILSKEMMNVQKHSERYQTSQRNVSKHDGAEYGTPSKQDRENAY